MCKNRVWQSGRFPSVHRTHCSSDTINTIPKFCWFNFYTDFVDVYAALTQIDRRRWIQFWSEPYKIDSLDVCRPMYSRRPIACKNLQNKYVPWAAASRTQMVPQLHIRARVQCHKTPQVAYTKFHTFPIDIETIEKETEYGQLRTRLMRATENEWACAAWLCWSFAVWQKKRKGDNEINALTT